MRGSSYLRIEGKVLKVLEKDLEDAITKKSIAANYLAKLPLDDPNRALIQASYDDAALTVEKLTPMVETKTRPYIKGHEPQVSVKKSRSHEAARFQKEVQGIWI